MFQEFRTQNSTDAYSISFISYLDLCICFILSRFFFLPRLPHDEEFWKSDSK